MLSLIVLAALGLSRVSCQRDKSQEDDTEEVVGVLGSHRDSLDPFCVAGWMES